jgi:hypothetical protein
MVSFARRALHLAAMPHPGPTLMIERGLGYWITPDDDFVPLPPRVSHADVIRELIDPSQLTELQAEARHADANSFALSLGWTRVRIYPGQRLAYVDCGSGKQSVHLDAVRDLLGQLDLPGLAIKNTDERGNYVSPP